MEIQGYPSYLIYSDGRVESKIGKGRFLKPTLGTRGYYYVGLRRDGKRTIKKIHRLLALHYIPNPENKKCVDHINRIRNDNRLENLRWATHCENSQNRGTDHKNTSGHKNISYDKSKDRWAFQKMINGECHSKYFKRMEEAISYRDQYLLKRSNHSIHHSLAHY